MYCSKCGKEIHDDAVICVHCGCAVNNRKLPKTEDNDNGEKNWVAAYMLAWFLGPFGAHRFYTGHIGTAIAQLFTFGGCLIWSTIDFIMLSFNRFKDNNENPLEGYIKILGMIGFGLFVFGTFMYILVTILTAAFAD
jgi:hypothetical protein